MQTATIKYIGDRPFFQANVDGVGRVVFNHHNSFTKELPTAACDSIMKQWGRFFKVDEMVDHQPAVVVEEEKVESLVVIEEVNPIALEPTGCQSKRPQGFSAFPPNTTKAERAVISAKLKKARDKRKVAAKKKKAAAIRLEKTGKIQTLATRQKHSKAMKAVRSETTWISNGPNKGLKYDRASVLAARYAAYFQSASH